MSLTALGHRYPDITERFFSRGLYVLFKETYGRVFGLLPVSAAQFLIFLLPAGAIYYIALVLRRIITDPPNRKQNIKRFAANAACTAGVVWFSFAMLCGINYARVSFAIPAGLEIRPSSAAELTALCDELSEKLAVSAANVTRDGEGRMVHSAGSYYALAQNARNAFNKAASEYPILGGFTPLPKPVIYSRLMSYANIVGIYVPFTMEATVNTDIPDYAIPSTMTHELAHFKGYMREDEANFIAYLACILSGDPDFIYSGQMLAFVHASNQLRQVNDMEYRRIMENLSDAVWFDFQANRAYWQQFEGPVAEFSTNVNDSYLRQNRQFDGVQSYGRMVDLLLADYRKRNNR
jgi:hypothetical protein